MSEAINGGIAVYIPRAFQGPIRAKATLGAVKYSLGIQSALTRFSCVDGVERGFLGNFEPTEWLQYEATGGTWAGDEMSLETRLGSVNICYVDELDVPEQPRMGLLSRLLWWAHPRS